MCFRNRNISGFFHFFSVNRETCEWVEWTLTFLMFAIAEVSFNISFDSYLQMQAVRPISSWVTIDHNCGLRFFSAFYCQYISSVQIVVISFDHKSQDKLQSRSMIQKYGLFFLSPHFALLHPEDSSVQLLIWTIYRYFIFAFSRQYFQVKFSCVSFKLGDALLSHHVYTTTGIMHDSYDILRNFAIYLFSEHFYPL